MEDQLIAMLIFQQHSVSHLHMHIPGQKVIRVGCQFDMLSGNKESTRKHTCTQQYQYTPEIITIEWIEYVYIYICRLII